MKRPNPVLAWGVVAPNGVIEAAFTSRGGAYNHKFQVDRVIRVRISPVTKKRLRSKK